MQQDILKIKESLFKNDEEIKKFLKKITKQLLENQIKDETISPLILTHKEFIDVSLKRILKKIKEELLKKAQKMNMPVFDKIFEAKLDYVAAYLIKEDMLKDKVIHKTIAKYILDIIKKEPLKLNNFVSTLNRKVYTTKTGKYEYPELYPFDKLQYTNPIPILKKELNKYETVKKQLAKMEEEYNQIKNRLEEKKKLIEDMKTALTTIKESIIPTLQKRYEKEDYLKRALIFSSQKKRFELLEFEAKEEIKILEKKEAHMKKSLEGFKEKHKEELEIEEKLIETLANNLMKIKKKI